MKHLLSIESISAVEIREILALAAKLKRERHTQTEFPLKGQCWGMIFTKSSTRTRVSFETGIRELGGAAFFMPGNELQLGRGEPVKDTARVMGRMLSGVVIRTFSQEDVEEFARWGEIPVINGLTDEEHPCQILADIQTIEERAGRIERKTICFVGDGACNMPRSWIWAASKLGFELRIAAPKAFQPSKELLAKAGGNVIVTEDLRAAAKGADVLYTDVWISMGKEQETEFRIAQLGRYQINSELIACAKPGALVMHCLPAYRGKEISEEALEAHARTIFDQAENRLHAQKAVLCQVAAAWRK